MIEYITYKKEKYPVRLSYRVFKGMKKDIGEVDFNKLKSLDSEVVETMLWHGLQSGAKHDGIELPFKKEDMEDVLDDCFFEFIKLIPKFFPKAKVGNENPNLEKEEEEVTT
jgi:hypothetical protein